MGGRGGEVIACISPSSTNNRSRTAERTWKLCNGCSCVESCRFHTVTRASSCDAITCADRDFTPVTPVTVFSVYSTRIALMRKANAAAILSSSCDICGDPGMLVMLR